jgi:hypothetical protein
MKSNEFYIAGNLRLSEKYFDLVLCGRKTSTIRKKHVLFNSLFVPLISGERKALIRILKLDYSKTFSDLNDEDARKDGFSSAYELSSKLKKFYPDISADCPMTIIHFKVEDKNVSESSI